MPPILKGCLPSSALYVLLPRASTNHATVSPPPFVLDTVAAITRWRSAHPGRRKTLVFPNTPVIVDPAPDEKKKTTSPAALQKRALERAAVSNASGIEDLVPCTFFSAHSFLCPSPPLSFSFSFLYFTLWQCVPSAAPSACRR